MIQWQCPECRSELMRASLPTQTPRGNRRSSDHVLALQLAKSYSPPSDYGKENVPIQPPVSTHSPLNSSFGRQERSRNLMTHQSSDKTFMNPDAADGHCFHWHLANLVESGHWSEPKQLSNQQLRNKDLLCRRRHPSCSRTGTQHL